MPPRVTRSSARLAAESSSTNPSSDPPQPPSTPLPSTKKRKASPTQAGGSPSGPQGTNTRTSRSHSKRLKVDDNSTGPLSGLDPQEAQTAVVYKDEAMSTAGYERYPSQARFPNSKVDPPPDTQTRILRRHPHQSQTSNLAPSLPLSRTRNQKVLRMFLLI